MKEKFLPEIWLNLSSFIGDEESSEARFEIYKDFFYKNHRFKLKDPLKGEVVFKKGKNNLSAHFEISAKIWLKCDRCLQPFAKKLQLEFDRAVSRQPEDSQESLLLTADNKVEVFEPIWQELILRIPARAICQPNCKGMCPICGTNWNEKECPHHQKVLLKEKEETRSPFAVLEKLKKSLKKDKKSD